MLTTAVGGPPSSPWTTPRQRFQAAARQPHSSCGSHSTLCCPADVFMVHGLFAQTLKPPLTPGSEGVGTVASFSERFPLGQRVVAGEGEQQPVNQSQQFARRRCASRLGACALSPV